MNSFKRLLAGGEGPLPPMGTEHGDRAFRVAEFLGFRVPFMDMLSVWYKLYTFARDLVDALIAIDFYSPVEYRVTRKTIERAIMTVFTQIRNLPFVASTAMFAVGEAKGVPFAPGRIGPYDEYELRFLYPFGQSYIDEDERDAAVEFLQEDGGGGSLNGTLSADVGSWVRYIMFGVRHMPGGFDRTGIVYIREAFAESFVTLSWSDIRDLDRIKEVLRDFEVTSIAKTRCFATVENVLGTTIERGSEKRPFDGMGDWVDGHVHFSIDWRSRAQDYDWYNQLDRQIIRMGYVYNPAATVSGWGSRTAFTPPAQSLIDIPIVDVLQSLLAIHCDYYACAINWWIETCLASHQGQIREGEKRFDRTDVALRFMSDFPRRGPSDEFVPRKRTREKVYDE